MDEIRFALEVPPGAPPDYPANAMPVVNGTRLAELIAAIEHRLGCFVAEYWGIEGRHVLLPSRHLLGEPLYPYRAVESDRHAAVLRCPACGHPECSGVAVEIVVDPDRVTWRDWVSSQDADEPIAGLPEMTFDRGRYVEALGDRRV